MFLIPKYTKYCWHTIIIVLISFSSEPKLNEVFFTSDIVMPYPLTLKKFTQIGIT